MKTIFRLFMVALCGCFVLFAVACGDLGSNETNDGHFTVIWKDHDGNILETDVNVEKGTIPTYDGDEPTRDNTTQFTYEFTGWSPTITEVTKDTIYIAQYSNKTNSYTITWKNYDGTIITEDLVKYGSTPSFEGAIPSKLGATFSGWSPAVVACKGNATYTATFDISYSIDNLVIVDNESLKFTIVKIEKGWLGTQVYVNCVNKTSNKELMFSWDDTSICGYMQSCAFASSVTPLNQSNTSFGFYFFEEDGIAAIDELTFTLRVYNNNDWLEDDLIKKEYTIYPTGLNADSVQIPVRQNNVSEEVIVSNDKVDFIILSSEISSSGAFVIRAYVENKVSNQELMFSWRDVSINGMMIDPYFAYSVMPGKRGYVEISFYKASLDSNNITKVNEVEFTLVVYDWNNILADKIVDQVFNWSPSN